MPRVDSLVTIIIVLVAAKLFTDLFIVVKAEEKTFDIVDISIKKQYSDLMNIDEKEMSRTAKYVLQDKGFLTDVSFDKPDFREKRLTISALRPKYQIYMHIIAIPVYTWAHPNYSLATQGDLPADYYEAFAIATFILKNILWIFSLFSFYELSRLFFQPTMSKIALCLYITYPSLFFYVGIMNIHDCTVTYCIVIIIAIIASVYYKKKQFTVKQATLIGLLMVITLLKSQAILILATIMLLLFVLYLPNIPTHVWRFTIISNLIFLIAIAPVFYQNYRDFKGVFLTTQSGVTFFHGHNHLARGSWYPGIWNAEDGYVLKQLEPYKAELIKGELAESKVYNYLAMKWIKENPGKEFILIIRKVAIFLLPYNFLNLKVNVITLLGHLGFLGFCIAFLVKRWYKRRIFLFILIPVIVVIFINVLFYVEYRWRMFADPFIVLMALYFYTSLWKWYRSRFQQRIVK